MKKSGWNTWCSLDTDVTAGRSVGCELRKQVVGIPAPGSLFLTQTFDLIAVHGLPLGPHICPAEALNLSRFHDRTENDIGTSVCSRDCWWKNSEVKWKINIRFLRDSQVWISKHHRFGSKGNNLENITSFLELLSIAQWPWVRGHQQEISCGHWWWDYGWVQWSPECCIWTRLVMSHSLSLITYDLRTYLVFLNDEVL